MRRTMYALCNQFGPPHFMLTLTPSDLSNGMVATIACGHDNEQASSLFRDFTADMSDESTVERTRRRQRNEAAMAHVNTARRFGKGHQRAGAMSKIANHKVNRAHYSVEHPGLSIIAVLGHARLFYYSRAQSIQGPNPSKTNTPARSERARTQPLACYPVGRSFSNENSPNFAIEPLQQRAF